MTMDTPYDIRHIVRHHDHCDYQIFHRDDGHVLTAHDFTTARMTVEALNKLVLERAIARVA